MKDVIEKLKQHESSTPSTWRSAAEYRRENKVWLGHSQSIALVMLEKMDALGMTQTALASQMNVSQQYISKILKGRENLSLETLSKIEEALHITVLLPV